MFARPSSDQKPSGVQSERTAIADARAAVSYSLSNIDTHECVTLAVLGIEPPIRVV